MIAVIQNDPEVPPGTLIRALEKGAVPHRVVELFANGEPPRLEQVSGAVVLGGIMSVTDTDAFPFLVSLKAWMREIVQREMPFLGICLGGQLLAEVAGGKVLLRTNGEYGCKPVTLTEAGIRDPLFRGVASPFVTFHWHTDCFVVPADGVHLARTKQCEFQAFRFGPRAYGLQFHPEVTPEIVAAWSEHTERHARTVADFAALGITLRKTSSLLFRNFLDLVQANPRRVTPVQGE